MTGEGAGRGEVDRLLEGSKVEEEDENAEESEPSALSKLWGLVELGGSKGGSGVRLWW